MRRFLRALIVCLLAFVCLLPLIGGLARLSRSEEVAKGRRLSAESVARLRNLGSGSYERPSTGADRSLVIAGLDDGDLAVSNEACLAVEKLAAEKAFDAPATTAALRLLIPKLCSPNDDTSEWSTRAVSSLAQDTHFVEGPLARRVQSEARRMLEDPDPEMRRRAANLSRSLLPCLQPNEFQELVRALLAACRRPVLMLNLDSARKRAGLNADGDLRAADVAVIALSAGGPLIEDKALASEVTVELLKGWKRALEGFGQSSIVGLAHLAKRVDEPLRQEIAKTVIAAVREPRCHYSLTSGLPSPPHHYGADALAVLAPLLDRKTLDAAAKAIPTQPDSWETSDDFTSMYAQALQALADRRHELDHERPHKSLQP
jgi:hypothetical protein